MNEVFNFEVCHGRGNLCGHVEENRRSEFLLRAVTQEVKKVALAHEFCDDVERRLPRANALINVNWLTGKLINPEFIY